MRASRVTARASTVAFCDTSADTSTLFGGHHVPQFVFDDTIFFGILGAASRPVGNGQGKLGGNSNQSAWDARALNTSGFGAAPPDFLASLTLSEAFLTANNLSRITPIHSFGNGGGYLLGDRDSIDQQAPYGINHTRDASSRRAASTASTTGAGLARRTWR